MAISITNLTSGSDSDGNSTATTASISPAADNLILLSITLRNGSSIDPSVSSVSGNGLTWVKIDSTVFDNSSTSRRTVELWRSMGASPSTGAITITASENETDINWSVDQSSGVDTSGTNGSGAIAQSAKNQDVTGTATGLVVTLAAFGSANNATFGVFGTDEVVTLTGGSGFTELAKINGAATPVSILTEWKSTNDTTVDATTGSVVFIGGIAIEIKAYVPPAGTITGLSSVTGIATMVI